MFLNHYFNTHLEFEVPKEAFYPVPKVTSAVVVLDKKTNIISLDEKKFLAFVKMAFRQKRKTLKNNLKEYWFIIEPILKANGYNPNVRAEELPYEMFVTLYQSII